MEKIGTNERKAYPSTYILHNTLFPKTLNTADFFGVLAGAHMGEPSQGKKMIIKNTKFGGV